ncbi:MAG: carboxypeptidase-like regulatory domain-containing protein [Bacteroidales bacterium]|nr:carboxypeptidase-like regulatory domain-containing protein [Bacteroidales bacterium]
MKHTLILILTVLFPFALLAQNITVRGKVVDAPTNEPLIGVFILQTGTQNGTITDINGNYSIQCPNDATLTFNYRGYATQTIFINGRTNLPVYMQ